jgi:hypothetical protein
MKVRQGFVSNSSSSSFVVAFAKVPQSREELKALLWGSQERLSIYDDGITTEEASRTLWCDLQEAMKEPLDAEGIALEVKGGHEFVNHNAGATFLRFTYADEDGPYFGTLEHGPTFDEVPHLQISHH